MKRLVWSVSAAVGAALLLGFAAAGSSAAPSRAATPCAGGERAGCLPPVTVIATVPPRPDVPVGFVTPPPAGTPEPRPDGYIPTATPCSGGERAGCLP